MRISGAWEEFTGKPLEPTTYKVKEESAVEESAVEESAVEESAVEESTEAEAPVDEEESEES